MITIAIRSTLLVLVLLLTTPPLGAKGAPLKCGPQLVRTEPVLFLDGEIVRVNVGSTLQHLDTSEIFSLKVGCMNPRDSTFNSSQGVPAISILTKEGLVRSARHTLAAIVELQDAAFRRASTYLEAVAEDDLPARPAPLQVSLVTTARGWAATATIDGLSTTCAVYDGDAPPPRPGMLPRQIDCDSSATFGHGPKVKL